MSWDVGLTDNGDLPVSPRHIAGTDLVVQKLRLRLERHRGEAVDDTADGIPWIELLSQKPFPLLRLDALLRVQINAVAEVTGIASLDVAQTVGAETVEAEAIVVIDAADVVALTIVVGPDTVTVNGQPAAYRATRYAAARRPR